jgi:predicted HTH domain antitoxin
MITLSIPVSEGALSALHLNPRELAREMRISAAVQWYAQGRVSQDKAAEIADLTRSDFIDALSNARVSPFQVTPESLREELADAD